MDRYGGLQTALTIALPGGLYLDIIMDRYGGPQTALIISSPGGCDGPDPGSRPERRDLRCGMNLAMWYWGSSLYWFGEAVAMGFWPD
jgi:hypothetical protein